MYPEPEKYLLPPTTYVPNSRLPVLVYRNVLASDPRVNCPTADSTTEQIEQNRWLKGGVFGTYWAHHFHSVTHEVYAIFKGKSKFLLGRGPLDSDDDVMDRTRSGRVEVNLESGDVIVLPSGVAHCSVTSEDDFHYVGLYPEGSPPYDNNWCKANADETHEKALRAAKVPIPQNDPIYGPDGPLVRIWRDADTKS